MALIFIATFFCLAYFFARRFQARIIVNGEHLNLNAPEKSRRNNPKTTEWKRRLDRYKTPEGRSLIEFYLLIHLATADPVAAFDRAILPDGRPGFRLNGEYADGANEAAKLIMARKNLTMEAICESVERLASFIDNEPNGKEIRQIIVATNDRYHISIRKYINKLIVSDKILDKSACLEVMAIPHEVYHSVLEGDIAIEETLVHGLSFLRAAGVWREGKNDSARMELFSTALDELRSLEEAGPDRAKRYGQCDAITELVGYVEKAEAKARRSLTAEEILPRAVRLSMKFISGNIDMFDSMFEEKTYSTCGEEEIFDRAMRMWEENKHVLLRGRALK